MLMLCERGGVAFLAWMRCDCNQDTAADHDQMGESS